MSPSCPWLVLGPKVFQLCINHLVLVLCMFMWVIKSCLFFVVSSWSSNMPLYPSKVLRARERALTPYSSVVSNLDSHLNPSRSWEHVILWAMWVTLFHNLIGKSDQLMVCASMLLNKTKKNYNTTQWYALAMVFVLLKFTHYLLGNKFIFYVDIWHWFIWSTNHNFKENN
jgi:hypothetical protein